MSHGNAGTVQCQFMNHVHCACVFDSATFITIGDILLQEIGHCTDLIFIMVSNRQYRCSCSLYDVCSVVLVYTTRNALYAAKAGGRFHRQVDDIENLLTSRAPSMQRD